VRGEYLFFVRLDNFPGGSPPRAWGIRAALSR